MGVQNLRRTVSNYFFQPCNTSPLEIMRISFFSILLIEVIQIFNFRDLYFQEIGLSGYENIILPIWILSLLGIILGLPHSILFKIVNYICTVLCLGPSHSVLEYHMDFAWLAVSFLCIFVPLNYKTSIEFLMHPNRTPPQVVPQIYYSLLIFVPIGLIYFDSIFFKWSSPMWKSMLGLWLPASLPPIAFNDLSKILDFKPLVIASSFITIIFETIFIFLFWFQRARIPLIITGVLLHLGIFVAFPIPWFALGYCALYSLLLYKTQLGQPLIQLDRYKTLFIASFMTFCFIFQLFLISRAPGIDPFKIGKLKFLEQLAPSMVRFFGVTHHPVFVDSHFTPYKNQYRIQITDHNGKIIELTNKENGMPVKKLDMLGRQWVYWAFRINSPYATTEEATVVKIKKYANYFIAKDRLCENLCQISIFKRDLNFKPSYQKGMATQLQDTPWMLFLQTNSKELTMD